MPARCASRRRLECDTTNNDLGQKILTVDIAIEACDLTKRYKGYCALDALSMKVPAGIVFGLLGPNGAGKTTLLRTLLGYIRASSGKASIFGKDVQLDSLPIRAMTTYLPAEAKLFRMMRGKAVLDFFCRVHPHGNLQRAHQIAKRLDLDLSRYVAFMSTGMRQKLAIASVLSTDARLIVLDEPTANLDPNVRGEVLTLIQESHQRGATVVLSSHILDEIEQICDHAAIVRSGKVRREVDLKKLGQVYQIRASHAGEPASLNYTLPAGLAMQASSNGVHQFELDVDRLDLDSAIRLLQQNQFRLSNIAPLGLQAVYASCSTSC